MTVVADSFCAPQRRSGHGGLVVEMVKRLSTVTSAWANNPLKVLVPRARGRSVWAYTSSFGGGLVAGDETQLDITVGPGTTVFVGTQASTKVYRNPDQRPCGHRIQVESGTASLLVFAPDPVQAFAGSRYLQEQQFQLAHDASLVVVDWFTSGRVACGERWKFDRVQSRSAIWRRAQSFVQTQAVTNELIFLDSLVLDAREGLIASKHRTGRFNCLATLVLLGPAVRAIATGILADTQSQPVNRNSTRISSGSPVQDGMVLRVAGEAVEDVGRELRRHLAPLSEMLGDDPWARKW